MNAKSNYTPMTVPFHSAELFIVEHNGQPYTPMKPIVEGMGLDWKSQFSKIKDKFSSSMVEITIQVIGDIQSRSYICLPVRKLAAWLYSVSPNKVKPEIRETVIKYQNECDDVLWDYWTGKLNAQRKAFDEFNQIEFDDKLSKAKATVSSLGMHARKREKRINEKRRDNWLRINIGLLDLGD
ncbi:phage antirepressor N-terminal domain-containing protein [Acinetobacter sp. FNA3]|nr:phage antirepressor N-terminal domain-containing protein [Acinetobacter pollinis]MBF7701611.1 phage antirepressor N-terminal domain-containing protein [Acinetobacter pollinis]